jgi:hypothetical protein
VCRALLLEWQDRIEGTICESEYVCDTCRMYELTFGYGYSKERLGFVWCEWSYLDRKPYGALDAACREIRVAFRHPDWKGLRRMPLSVVADWFGDHDCPAQERAVRAGVAEILAAAV